jgi:hypothetical protein
MNAAGVDVAGLLPGDLNEVTAFGAGITASCKDVDAATALLKFLQSPEAAKVFKASGFEPDHEPRIALQRAQRAAVVGVIEGAARGLTAVLTELRRAIRLLAAMHTPITNWVKNGHEVVKS